jgi:YVTN family beta-propeller protein
VTSKASTRSAGKIELFEVLDAWDAAPIQPPASAETVVATIPVGGRPGALAVSPAGRYLYVTTDDSVTPIHTSGHHVTTIRTGGHPQGIALTHDGRWGYIPGYDGSLSIIDTAHHTVRTVPVDPISDHAVSPDGELFYAAHNATIDGEHVGWISATDTDGAAAGAMTVPGYVSGLAVSPDGTRLYAVTSDPATYYEYAWGAVQVIDIRSGHVIETIDVGVSPDTVTMHPDGRRLYVTHHDTGSVSAVDLDTSDVVPIILDDQPLEVTVTPDGRRAVVTSVQSVSIIDTATLAVAPVPVGDMPRGVAISPDSRRIYVANYGGQSVSVIDSGSNSVTSTVYVGGHPGAVVVSPRGGEVYVGDYWAETVTVIATRTTGEVVPSTAGAATLAAAG